MKYLTTFFLTLCWVSIAVSQDITLKFTGRFSNGDYVRMDSVQVENISKEWKETLFFPDTVLILSAVTGINEANNVGLSLKAYPNPCEGLSSVYLQLDKPDDVRMEMFSLSGQRLATFCRGLDAGNYLFEVALNTSQVFLLTVHTSHADRSIKLMNIGDGGRNAIVLKGKVSKAAENMDSKQSFHAGDVLRYTGYITYDNNVVASQQILQAQKVSENFLLIFTVNMQSHDLPQVKTDTISDITETIALCGGNVIYDGNHAVMSRGVCWSTSHNPTIVDQHTSDGSEVGMFKSVISGLIAGTTYYVRAYATNANGTAYGEERILVTLKQKWTDGVLPGLFSVSETKQVRFSQGNLQYSNLGEHVVATGDTVPGTWRFATNQFDTIGEKNLKASSTYTGWIDLFGRGTSGYEKHYPYMNDTFNYCYPTSNIAGTYYDWGIYNTISNGGGEKSFGGIWYTLSMEEWQYLMWKRSDANKKMTMATIEGVRGVVLLPDLFNKPPDVGFVSDNIDTNVNVYTKSDWNKMENAGALFIPACGVIYNGVFYDKNVSCYIYSSTGYYSSSSSGVCFSMPLFTFKGGFGGAMICEHYQKLSVRLVQDVRK